MAVGVCAGAAVRFAASVTTRPPSASMSRCAIGGRVSSMAWNLPGPEGQTPEPLTETFPTTVLINTLLPERVAVPSTNKPGPVKVN